MHQTEAKRAACALPAWHRRNADRVCQHGDSGMLREIKRAENQRRRQADKRESREI